MGDFSKIKEDVPYRGLKQEDIQLIQESFALLEGLEVPQLYDANNSHSRIFFVLADGTGNDLSNPEKYTNVANLYEELRNNFENHPRIGFDYVEGVGTQDKKFAAGVDGLFAYSFKGKADRLYRKLSNKVAAWKREDPNVEIAVVHVGFSRGCGVSAYLNQKIHNEGILNPRKAVVNGKAVDDILIEPGKIKQAAVMYDPVLTNMRQDNFSLEPHDFTLSDSTVSVLQINANDEIRKLFPLTHFIDEGLSINKHCLSCTLPGAHSDIGSSYSIDGLGKLSRAMKNSYLNVLMGEEHFKKVKIPGDLKEYAIHDSSKHHPVYQLFTQVPRGLNDMTNRYIGRVDNKLPTRKIDFSQELPSVFEISSSISIDKRKQIYTKEFKEKTVQQVEKNSSINNKKYNDFEKAAKVFTKLKHTNKPAKEKNNDIGFGR